MGYNFKVNEQVVCISDKWAKGTIAADGRSITLISGTNLPVKDGIYRIIDKEPNGSLYLDQHTTATFTDIKGNSYFSNKVCFEPQNFRPLVTKTTETGMAVLREIARTCKLPAKPKKKKETIDG